MRHTTILALATLVACAACTTARKTEPLAPPTDPSDPKIARGEKIFYQSCHQCHPNGQGGLGPAIVNKPLPEFLMKFQVRHGLGAMPSFGADKIPPDDLEALTSYIQAVRQKPSSVAR
jgi:mono/diheme cytochrome c family protein